MDKHTAGPWHADKYWVRSSRDDLVATVGHFRDAETVSANSRLISAAPDLLAALEGIIGEYAGISDKWSIDARAAIAKAKESQK